MPISPIYVPSIGPKDAKILFVGEAPGEEEEREKEPFVGMAGDKLTTCLGRNGIERLSAFFTNLSKHRPTPDNKFERLLNSQELTDGLKELEEEIKTIQPNVIVPLGAWPLYYLTGKSGKQPGTGIMHWRGSILPCCLPNLTHIKCIPTFHPSYVNRNAKEYPAFDADIKRISKDQHTKALNLPKRKLVINPTPDELEYYVGICLEADSVAVDIETFGSVPACVGFAPSKDLGICIPWGSSETNRQAIKRLLGSHIRKITHFGFFDWEFLFCQVGIDIDPATWYWDTYVAQHVMWPELPNTLAYLTSIETREPYYKHEGKEAYADQKVWGSRIAHDQLWAYNCKDVCVTKEIAESQERDIASDSSWKTFLSFEMDQARGELRHISRAGMLVDINRRTVFAVHLRKEWAKKQLQLNQLAGYDLSPKTLRVPGTDVEQWVNVNSSKQCAGLFYEIFGMPARKKRGGQVTCDEDALINMMGIVKKEYDTKKRQDAKDKWLRVLLCLKLVIIIRGIRKKLSSYVDTKLSIDGRCRSLYKVGPETGRWAAEKYVDGTGLNLMTIPRDGVEIDAD